MKEVIRKISLYDPSIRNELVFDFDLDDYIVHKELTEVIRHLMDHVKYHSLLNVKNLFGSKCSIRNVEIFQTYFGLDGYYDSEATDSVAGTARKFGLTTSRTAQIIQKIERALRHPTRSRWLKEVMYGCSDEPEPQKRVKFLTDRQIKHAKNNHVQFMKEYNQNAEKRRKEYEERKRKDKEREKERKKQRRRLNRYVCKDRRWVYSFDDVPWPELTTVFCASETDNEWMLVSKYLGQVKWTYTGKLSNRKVFEIALGDPVYFSRLDRNSARIRTAAFLDKFCRSYEIFNYGAPVALIKLVDLMSKECK
jgi:hypothetical protein